jgi:hypothetical protein
MMVLSNNNLSSADSALEIDLLSILVFLLEWVGSKNQKVSPFSDWDWLLNKILCEGFAIIDDAGN